MVKQRKVQGQHKHTEVKSRSLTNGSVKFMDITTADIKEVRLVKITPLVFTLVVDYYREFSDFFHLISFNLE